MAEQTQGLDAGQVPIKLILFIDQRPSSGEYAQQLRHYLKQLSQGQPFSLDVIDVGEQPYLVEHFKLVATPALVKIAPALQQVLKGSNINSQLDYWWPQWQQEAASAWTAFQDGKPLQGSSFGQSPIAHSVEIMKLSDEIFRLKQEKEELEAQLEFKDRIVAMLAHDLRNPLTAASIAVETLELGYAPKQTQKKMVLSAKLTAQLLTHAKTQIRAIDRMITDILQTAKGATADLLVQPQEINLASMLGEVVEAMKGKVQAKDQSLDLEIPQDLPRVYIDGEQVRRVLLNLLDNAIKYTPAHGRISIAALHRTTQKIQVMIGDTGPGVPEENWERIFEESFRLQRDQNKEGYGLGLALCRRIIRAHYGQIWVESNAGEGSQFIFTLPVYRA
ncbi:MAG: histidine kinase [Cyanobacteria bacterium]|nr:histidine kinase [Cyanobacteriota bacterium]MDA0865911.1 histidine kinase [Cyanobacteriota bacterium]